MPKIYKNKKRVSKSDDCCQRQKSNAHIKNKYVKKITQLNYILKVFFYYKWARSFQLYIKLYTFKKPIIY